MNKITCDLWTIQLDTGDILAFESHDMYMKKYKELSAHGSVHSRAYVSSTKFKRILNIIVAKLRK